MYIYIYRGQKHKNKRTTRVFLICTINLRQVRDGIYNGRTKQLIKDENDWITPYIYIYIYKMERVFPYNDSKGWTLVETL